MDKKFSDRFMSAFRMIEQFLRRITQFDSNAKFGELLNKASVISKPVKEHFYDLRKFGDLRNAIAHEGEFGETIAEPHLNVVEKIEHIRDLITQPPQVGTSFSGVEQCSPHQPIGPVIRGMAKRSFSQIPVYKDGHFQGLLTTDAVARWIAKRFQIHGGLAEQETVEEVMAEREITDNFRMVGRDATYYDVIDLFDQANKSGKRLDAIIVTHSGSQNEKPIGFITVFDLPQIYEEIRI